MKTKIIDYIDVWEARCYSNGIPDEAPKRLEDLNKVPSYRQLCMAILKNDFQLKSLGYTPVKSRFYHTFKKIEIEQRNKTNQLKLF